MMYCYKCAKMYNQIIKVNDGAEACIRGHSQHISLDKEMELPKLIYKIREHRKRLKDSQLINEIKEYIKCEKAYNSL